MAFASDYLTKGALFPPLTLNQPPRDGLGIVVVIPAYDEPEIDLCLASLAACTTPQAETEVIVVVNAGQDSGIEGIAANNRTKESIERWQRSSQSVFFRLLVIDTGQPAIKGWGVGAARKTGMDEAVRRFGYAGNPQGVILSLDADCLVADDYLVTVWDSFGRNDRAGGCSIGFRHRLNEPGTGHEVASAVMQYELHLRYFVSGLKYASFPYAFHTIGSALAVKAARYVAAGGMSRKQGGEDFYFIQKIVASDDFIELRKILVFPSSRVSSRVPFGTGPALVKILAEANHELLTYNPEAFSALRDFFDMVRTSLHGSTFAFPPFDTIPAAIGDFLGRERWQSNTAEIMANTSRPAAVLKRFFLWFNAFMIVRFLNHAHSGTYKRVTVNKAASDLLLRLGIEWPADKCDTGELLDYFRMVDSL